MATKTITPKNDYQELRDGGQSVLKGLYQLNSALHGIKVAARAAASSHDPLENLEHIAMLSDLGAEHALVHIDRLSILNDTIDDILDELDEPTVDMMKSGLQADSIQQSLAALLQVIPEDQADTIGSLKTVLKLAHDLSTHLVSGGRYRLVLKEALEEADAA